VEPLKDAFAVRFSDPWAGVVHYQDHPVALAGHPNVDSASFVGIPARIVD
jgi:hypothetical protein